MLDAHTAEPLDRGDFVRLAYRLGASRATGVLTVFLDDGDADVLVLRRGHLVPRGVDPRGTKTRLRLERVAAAAALAHFDGGVAAYPPGGRGRAFCLALWAREHLEAQLDQRRAEELVAELAGARLAILAGRVPADRLMDDTDRRIVAAMRQPRRLDQIVTMARTPRYRLLTFLHFLRAIGAVDERGVVADAAEPRDTDEAGPLDREAALRALGLEDSADHDRVKRAYRRLARALHPDLHPDADPARRRCLERRFAEVSSAYRAILGPVISERVG